MILEHFNMILEKDKYYILGCCDSYIQKDDDIYLIIDPKSISIHNVFNCVYKNGKLHINCKELDISIDYFSECKILFPKKDEDKWSFIRGLFDVSGSIEFNKSYLVISLNHFDIKAIKQFLNDENINTLEGPTLYLQDMNALDFLDKLYNNIYCTNDNYNKYQKIKFNLNGQQRLTCFYEIVDLDARPPFKARCSDAGYDLYIIKEEKKEDDIIYFDTGLKIQPPMGIYFKMVGRSSIIRTGYSLVTDVPNEQNGYTLETGISIIDCSYRGRIIVPLRKTDKSKPDIKLPNRLVQLIPQRMLFLNMIEQKVSSTSRNEGGFGSTNLS